MTSEPPRADDVDRRRGRESRVRSVELPSADLGAAEVLEDRYGLLGLDARSADAFDALPMLFVGAVREVEASDVHSRVDELRELLLGVAGRTDGADDLRSPEAHPEMMNPSRGTA